MSSIRAPSASRSASLAGLLAAGGLGAAWYAQIHANGQLLPHAFCISASQPLLYLHLVSDSLIAFAYLLIPWAMLVFVRKRPDLPFSWVAWVFGAFILACSATHALDVWTLFYPVYWLSGTAKALTAIVSLATAGLLYQLLPHALALPSAAQLHRANAALQAEVAARKQAEAELRAAKAEVDKLLSEVQQRADESATILHRFFEEAPAGMALLDQDLRFALANASLANAAGRKIEDYQDTKVVELPRVPPRVIDAMKDVVATGKARTNVEVAGTFADGRDRSWRCSFFPIGTGGAQMFGLIVEDITREVAVARERTRALESLANAARRIDEERAQFHSLADNIAQLAWMADASGTIYWCNRRWFEYTGTTPAEVQGRGIRIVQHPDHAQRVEEKLRRHFETGEPWEDTFPMRRKDGSYRWFLSRAFPLRDPEGRILRWFGTNTDITEQMKAQDALREADRRKDEFIAALAHELRNPLAPVRNAVEILGRVAHADARVDRMVAVIRRQVAHMARLIDDLLDVARIARGKLDIQLVDCDLGEIAATTARDYEDSLRQAGIELQIRLPDQPLPVCGDPVRLAQAIGNYLQNAVRFAAGTPVEVSARTDPDRNEAVVSVTDRGAGIAADLLSKLFEPFAQAGQDLARSKGGLGLGLALAKGVAELHGGRALARNNDDAPGATFEIRIPLRAAANPVDLDDAAASQHAEALRVLVIEDNPDSAETLRVLLETDGHEVRAAEDGERGAREAADWLPDVVLCDLGLPGSMDGYDVARVLRSSARTAHLRLVALSGYADAAAVRQSRAAGFEVHLAKPVDYERLLQELHA